MENELKKLVKIVSPTFIVSIYISFIIKCKLEWISGIYGPQPKIVKNEMW